MYTLNSHNSIMKNEVIKYLNIINNGIYIDGTFGSGGHSLIILEKLSTNSKLFVFDKDINSINIAKLIKDSRFFYKHSSFTEIKNFLNKKKLLGKVNGIIIDLGISKDQIFNSKRGFTFLKNEILDMRMDNTIGIPAFLWLKKASIKDINKVFNKFGEEYKYSKQISEYIYNYNKHNTIKYTFELIKIINLFHKKKYKRINNVTKYFQAIRIFINNELYNIKKLLSDIVDILDINGRLIIISFNSLETKIIKNFFNIKNYNINNIPLHYKDKRNFINIKNNLYMKKIIKLKPNKEEIIKNKSSRSAIMTIFEKKMILLK
ncbi:ribosomal RNA small subunit methyltransferase H [endosymbiont of Euscepes postfasciatus]|uniref:16S rRNA (cytosine(1402)-N(4))-methyltransferase RsmH n=1 Tax=endosymbiont of Euscepes postfasciatus TaxID=650377 RepID=UPI000DC70387|nr:16S rRNA (cytosine(1402)-N(4))-methyltransferase RsmH [endosymbiont of Euscepes postfasciatus]BBA84551.1 ribosomal RNA small subunit methyltransferase H [endosymbiont of Euscepes postfasciatus]